MSFNACVAGLFSFVCVRLARLVRVVLGSSAVANRKLETGNPLVLLGVLVETNLVGATYVPPPEKLSEWILLIKYYLQLGILGSGEASKLAGRLNWASQEIFDKLGRALLVPIYAHMRSRSSVIGWELKLALRWWLQTLERGMCQVRVWKEIHTEPLQLLCDARCVRLRSGLACLLFCLLLRARSTPPRVAAVLAKNSDLWYTDCAPANAVLSQFRIRGDNQIASLEMLAIAYGECQLQRACCACLCSGMFAVEASRPLQTTSGDTGSWSTATTPSQSMG